MEPSPTADVLEYQREIIRPAEPFTMTSFERLLALVHAVEHVVEHNLPGAFVECGVWRGGSILTMLRTLQYLKRTDRDVHLFDTFEGMSPPTDDDVSYDGEKAETRMDAENAQAPETNWLASSLEQVQSVVLSSGYPVERIKFVKGMVEQTIPEHAPEHIALLRLDTDWYESTRHELVHLFPRLVRGGIIIIDDYGHWKGCRKAVDEYIKEHKLKIFLQRIDYTGRIAVKE